MREIPSRKRSVHLKETLAVQKIEVIAFRVLSPKKCGCSHLVVFVLCVGVNSFGYGSNRQRNRNE